MNARQTHPDYLRWFLANITAWGVGVGLCALIIAFPAVQLEPFTYWQSDPRLPDGAYVLIIIFTVFLGGAMQGVVAYRIRQWLYGLPWTRKRARWSMLGGIMVLPVIAIIGFFTALLLEKTLPDMLYLDIPSPYDDVWLGGLLLAFVAPIFGSLAALVRLKLIKT